MALRAQRSPPPGVRRRGSPFGLGGGRSLRRRPSAPAGSRGAGRRGTSGCGQRLTQGAERPLATPEYKGGPDMVSVTDVESIEATGEKFSLQELLYVRARTRRAVHMIADRVKVGMSEDEAKQVARTILTSLGMRRGWHHIIVRCGPNTTKDFMERSEPGVVLGENDIFFIDIGPIF